MEEIKYEDVVDWLPIRPDSIYKNLLGHVLCVGGSSNMGGAIMMSSQAVVYSGAGLVTVATDISNKPALHTRLPEVMYVNPMGNDEFSKAINKADTILIGPGMGTDQDARFIFKNVLENISSDQVLVMDADALNIFSEDPIKLKAKETIITPHLGEWHRLKGLDTKIENQEDNLKLAKDLGVIAVVKSHETKIYIEGECYYIKVGNPSMATGGMGDTLAGMIAGFLHQYPNIKEAVLSAVYLHSYIGDYLARDRYVVLPTEISKVIPKIMKKLQDEKLNL